MSSNALHENINLLVKTGGTKLQTNEVEVNEWTPPMSEINEGRTKLFVG